jgi:hypothetical protein
MGTTPIELLSPLGVRCVDASYVRSIYPVRGVPANRGWQLKPYSIVHSEFEEVLFIDADNVPAADPAYLLDDLEYRESGSMFWPDREPLPRGWQHLRPEENMWDVCDVAFRSEPTFETGQMLIDKRKCWACLHIALHMNEQAEFYYPLGWGDTETFHFAWLLQAQRYCMVPFNPIDKDGLALFQHDSRGRIVFHHRCGDKWRWDGKNVAIPGFEGESNCLGYVDELLRRIGENRARRP